MESKRVRGLRDRYPGLPSLTLGLSSVRFIVNTLETEYARSQERQIVKYDPNIGDEEDFPLEPSTGQVWSFAGRVVNRCIPSVTFGNFGVLALASGLFAPRMISYLVIYPFCRLVFGTLYPAYASYKAVRTKNLKEYVKWMMYWIVFALFTCTETFTDMFLSWFPFYYEVKIVLVLWLLSPATKGSSILYRKFVHPALCRREQEIDEYIAKAKDQGYHTVLNLGTKGVNYATTVIMQTAIKGGGGLVQQLRKSYSLSDLSECEPRDVIATDEADDVMTEPQLIRRNVVRSGYNTRRSASESNSRAPMYFPEVDVDVRPRTNRADEPDFSHIKSSEDISSGYSSADNSASLSRAASVGAGARRRQPRPAVTSVKRPQPAEDSEVIIEEFNDDDNYDYSNMPALLNTPSVVYLSHTDPPFLYQYAGDQVKIIQVLGPPNYPLTETIQNTEASQRDQKDNISKQDQIDDQEVFGEAISEDIPDDNNNERDDMKDNFISQVFDNHEVAKTNMEPIILGTAGDKFENCTDKTPYLKEVNNNTSLNSTLECDKVEKISDILLKAEEFGQTKDSLENTSLDISFNDIETAEGDDEASFGTPEDSPKSKRKSPKGKYGKGKAPPPPKLEPPKVDEIVSDTTSLESLEDILNSLPNTSFKETGVYNKNLQAVNPITEKKRRHKSKSPGHIPKTNTSAIGKLFQLPGKFAFWHKTKSDDASVSSDQSRRSSAGDRVVEDRISQRVSTNTVDEFQSCADLTIVPNVADDGNKIYQSAQINDIDDKSISIESEVVTQDIMEKSDVLQKLIDAKIESHPEYKFISLTEDAPTTSKSTEV